MAFTEEEMAQYQRLSNDYVPDTQLSNLDHLYTLSSLYANAPEALAFGYFEALLHSGEPSRVFAEVARLTSLNNLLDTVGYPRDIYEDFVDETLQLLKRTATMTSDHDAAAALLTSFTQQGVCNAIIMHFRVSVLK
ncbi:MAG: hypothetical protein Q9201_007849 [Fulgogasparrea decipioides]